MEEDRRGARRGALAAAIAALALTLLVPATALAGGPWDHRGGGEHGGHGRCTQKPGAPAGETPPPVDKPETPPVVKPVPETPPPVTKPETPPVVTPAPETPPPVETPVPETPPVVETPPAVVTAVPTPVATPPTPTALPVVRPAPRLRVRKAGPPRVRAGTTARFRITVTNRGAGTARRARVVDVLPAGMSVVRARSPRVRLVSGRPTWRIARLAAGASRTIVVTVHASALMRAGARCNRVVATAPGSAAAAARACFTVVPGPPRRRQPSVAG